jgi:hypothetical protein
MGLFSKCCAKTHLPVMYSHPGIKKIAPHLTQIMVLCRGEEPYPAEYDGYGLGLMNTGQYDSAKFVLLSAYAGETYDQLPHSEDEPQQGYFITDLELEALARIPAFASHDAYCDFMSDTDALSEQAHKELLKALGAPESVPWYKVTSCFEAVTEYLEMPSYETLAERYAKRRAELPELMAFMPEKPAEAAEMVKKFNEDLTARLRKAYAELVDAVLATQAAASGAPAAGAA